LRRILLKFFATLNKYVPYRKKEERTTRVTQRGGRSCRQRKVGKAREVGGADGLPPESEKGAEHVTRKKNPANRVKKNPADSVTT